MELPIVFEFEELVGEWTRIRLLGSGSFGVVHEVTDGKGGLFALKIEPRHARCGQIANEVDMLRRLHKVARLPRVISSKLGPSLDKKLALFDGTLTLMTCCALGTDILQQLELIHAAGICHRDLKPENLCLCSRFEGEGEGDDAWTLIDFGLATALKAPSLPLSVATVPRSGGGAVVGTARYASIAAHQGRPLTPRDDVESLAYVMLYCCRGEKLPWQGLGARYRDKTIRNAKVGEIKALCSPKSLVEGTLAAPLEAFIVKAFEKKPEPDYQQLRFLLTAVATASSLTAATPLKAAAPLRTFTQP